MVTTCAVKSVQLHCLHEPFINRLETLCQVFLFLYDLSIPALFHRLGVLPLPLMLPREKTQIPFLPRIMKFLHGSIIDQSLVSCDSKPPSKAPAEEHSRIWPNTWSIHYQGSHSKSKPCVRQTHPELVFTFTYQESGFYECRIGICQQEV